MSNQKKYFLVPAIIIITNKEWKKRNKPNYIILDQGQQKIRLGTFVSEESIDNKTIIKPNKDELKIIEKNL